MSKLKYVIRHEFKLTAANKTFVILTILGPFLIFAITVLPTLLATSPEAAKPANPIAIYGASASLEEALYAAFSGVEAKIVPSSDLEAAKSAVLKGDLQRASRD